MTKASLLLSYALSKLSIVYSYTPCKHSIISFPCENLLCVLDLHVLESSLAMAATCSYGGEYMLQITSMNNSITVDYILGHRPPPPPPPPPPPLLQTDGSRRRREGLAIWIGFTWVYAWNAGIPIIT